MRSDVLPHYSVVVMSDVHLGSPASRAEDACEFLAGLTCEHLVLNGDIIDGWQLRRGAMWTDRATRYARLVLSMLERGTRVTYLRGNHDEFLSRALPLSVAGLEVVEELILHTPAGPYVVVHGDAFDALIRRGGVLEWVADQGYGKLLWLNRQMNRVRRWSGRDDFSLAAAVKSRVGSAVAYVERFEKSVCDMARLRGCVGAITGHIHVAGDKVIDGVHYLNSGDWVESCTALLQGPGGGPFELVRYQPVRFRAGATAGDAEPRWRATGQLRERQRAVVPGEFEPAGVEAVSV